MPIKKKPNLPTFFSFKKRILFSNISSHSPNLRYITDKCLSIVTFSAEDIIKINQNLSLIKENGMITLLFKYSKYVLILFVNC